MSQNHACILVVDDEPNNLDLISRRLTSAGYSVTTASSGRGALETMKVERYDLVLLDLMMPEMDGYETLAQMKDDPSLIDVPVIIVSAYSDGEHIKRCLEAGADDYLVKPFDFNEVKMRIWRCLVQRQAAGVEHPPVQSADVLVVDDEELNRHLLARRLTSAGYRPTCVVSGREALKSLDERRFGAILMDIRMPELNGIETLRLIRKHPLWGDTPVIMLSALDDSATKGQCYDAGADDYLSKPFNPVVLRARLSLCIAAGHFKTQEAVAVL